MVAGGPVVGAGFVSITANKLKTSCNHILVATMTKARIAAAPNQP